MDHHLSSYLTPMMMQSDNCVKDTFHFCVAIPIFYILFNSPAILLIIKRRICNCLFFAKATSGSFTYGDFLLFSERFSIVTNSA